MSLKTKIEALATRIATEIKAIKEGWVKIGQFGIGSPNLYSGGTLFTNPDLISNTGFYMLEGELINVPSEVIHGIYGSCFLINFDEQPSWGKQILIDASNTGTMYIRSKDVTWQSWVKIISEGNSISALTIDQSAFNSFIVSFSSDTSYLRSGQIFRRSRGTSSAKTNTQASDWIAQLRFEGWNGYARPIAEIIVEQTSAWNNDLVDAQINFYFKNPDTVLYTFRSNGKVLLCRTAGGIAIRKDNIEPTAFIHIGASNGTPSSAPIKLDAGTLLSIIEAGTIEYDGSKFYITTNSGIRRVIASLNSSANPNNTSHVIACTCNTAIGTVAKTIALSDATYTPVAGDRFVVNFINGNNVSAITLNINGTGDKLVKFNNANTSSNTSTLAAGALLEVYYDGTYYHMLGSQRTTDSDTYDRMYWNASITAGVNIYSYKLLMQAADGKYYPLTLENGTGATKTVSTQEFILNCPILYYNSTTTINAGTSTVNVYSEIITSSLNYTANTNTFTNQLPIYLKGTILANGNFKLDATSATSWLTQTLPTSDDGFVYILLGYISPNFRLIQYHPIYHYKDGAVRPYTPPIGYGMLSNTLKSYATLTSGTNIDLSANLGGKITLSANTAFSFINYQLGKTYELIITANGYTPSWANGSKHIAMKGNEPFGSSGVFHVILTCIDATAGSEKLRTQIMIEL